MKLHKRILNDLASFNPIRLLIIMWCVSYPVVLVFDVIAQARGFDLVPWQFHIAAIVPYLFL